jgi:hypothetical protein
LQFLGFWVLFDVAIRKNNWKFGLMLRDITTILTWNIGEEEYQKIANSIPGKSRITGKH